MKNEKNLKDMIGDNFIEMPLESQEKVNGGLIPPVITVAYAAAPVISILQLFNKKRG